MKRDCAAALRSKLLDSGSESESEAVLLPGDCTPERTACLGSGAAPVKHSRAALQFFSCNSFNSGDITT
jgi:hypothetical protein